MAKKYHALWEKSKKKGDPPQNASKKLASEKQEVELLIKKINQLLIKDPESIKKAANIISELINQEQKKK